LLIVVLFGILKCKNICHTIYFFNNTIIVQVRYIIIETKEFARIGYNRFLFPHSYSGDGRGAMLCYAPRPSPEYSCGKRNPLYPIWAASFVSIVLYLIHTCTYNVHTDVTNKNIDIKGN
jgi:hypothetical protein